MQKCRIVSKNVFCYVVVYASVCTRAQKHAHHARAGFFLNIIGALIKHVWPSAVVHRAHQNRVLLKNITDGKNHFYHFQCYRDQKNRCNLCLSEAPFHQ
jgi:hypothetical protein